MGTNYRNYSIKGSNGKFYETSKDKHVDYPIEYKTKSGEIRWHRDSTALEGVLKKIKLQEFQFPQGKVTFLRIMFNEDSGDKGTLSIPLRTQKGGLDPWIKAFMLYLPALHKGDKIKIQLNRQEKDKKGYLYKNVWMHRLDDEGDEDQIKWAFDPMKDVPKAIQGKDPLDGSPKWDFTPVDKWYYDYLMKVIDAWGGHVGDADDDDAREERSQQPEERQSVYSGGEAPDSSAYDDLPF